MNDIVKGVLGGGWSLIVGWVVPTALNLGLLILFAIPGLPKWSLVEQLGPAHRSAAFVGASVVIGLTLSALQTPLYRVLEGYLFWPAWAFGRGRKRQLRLRQRLRDRVRVAHSDGQRTVTQRAVLGERLRRYPVDDQQVVATRLGNAIRRLEEYGYDRFQLDSQSLWYELVAVVPEEARRQVDTARAGVDFFVCLMYGHLLVAATAAGLGQFAPAAILLAFAAVWYRLAVIGTDDWADAVRALVNTGRKPLAESFGLTLPGSLAEERIMWSLVSKLSRLPYHEKSAALDEFRAKPQGSTG